MVDPDQLKDDPFFRLPPADSDWNACIGKQGTEENYLDGYIEAAIELVGTIIDNKMLEKRDTVVLPILYNARHAIELVLKFIIRRLANVGLLSQLGKSDHNIRNYLELLEQAKLGDEVLRDNVRALKPFVESLSRVDKDGQELRYHTNRADDQSLSDYSLANLEVIRESLGKLSNAISIVKNRTIEFIDERSTNTYTKALSRRDLMSAAEILPKLDRWREQIFGEKRQLVISRFGLSNRQFCKAIDVIKANRELKAKVGGETTLVYLPDHLIIWIVEQWRKLHPLKESRERVNVVRLDKETLKSILEHSRIENEVISALQKRLTDQQLAEFEVIFSLGRDRWFSEFYEERIERTIQQHRVESDPCRQIRHLITKPNLLQALLMALPRLGRASLSAKLSKISAA